MFGIFLNHGKRNVHTLGQGFLILCFRFGSTLQAGSSLTIQFAERTRGRRILKTRAERRITFEQIHEELSKSPATNQGMCLQDICMVCLHDFDSRNHHLPRFYHAYDDQNCNPAYLDRCTTREGQPHCGRFHRSTDTPTNQNALDSTVIGLGPTTALL